MSITIHVDDEVYEHLQENARPFEPVWRAARRALDLEVPPQGISLKEFEAQRTQTEEPTNGQARG